MIHLSINIRNISVYNNNNLSHTNLYQRHRRLWHVIILVRPTEGLLPAAARLGLLPALASVPGLHGHGGGAARHWAASFGVETLVQEAGTSVERMFMLLRISAWSTSGLKLIGRIQSM